MKLLLTSSGLTNTTLKNAFLELLDKPVQDTSLAFIDTASNVEPNTDYVEQDFKTLQALGMDITRIDISEPKNRWEKILHQSDVIYVEGGNTFYLLDQFRKSGADRLLASLVESKIYVGVSAGSIVVTPDIGIAGVEPADPNDVNLTDFTGLGFVDFQISPHTPEIVSFDAVEKYVKTISCPLYAIDNNSAVRVTLEGVEIVGEGQKMTGKISP